MEKKTKSEKQKTKPNDIATSNTTTDPSAAVVPDSSAPLPAGVYANGAALSANVRETASPPGV